MRDQTDLPKRDREVLVALLRQFISSGIPVGSKALAAQLPEALSSATIRTVLAGLEEGGFLVQPHTSAGRIPTEMAYRFYVDRVVAGARLEDQYGRGFSVTPQESGVALDIPILKS